MWTYAYSHVHHIVHISITPYVHIVIMSIAIHMFTSQYICSHSYHIHMSIILSTYPSHLWWMFVHLILIILVQMCSYPSHQCVLEWCSGCPWHQWVFVTPVGVRDTSGCSGHQWVFECCRACSYPSHHWSNELIALVIRVGLFYRSLLQKRPIKAPPHKGGGHRIIRQMHWLLWSYV